MMGQDMDFFVHRASATAPIFAQRKKLGRECWHF
jgi:hypothetical protein